MLIQRGAFKIKRLAQPFERLGEGVAQGNREEAGPGRGITKGHFWKPDLPAEVPAYW